MPVRNIIFDLGGVLLNIDYQLTIDAFKKLGVSNFEGLFTQAVQIDLFDRFDKGVISSAGFREELRRITDLPLTDQQIDSAWNAMLLDMPGKRLAMLDRASKHYRLFLLSNTNTIHYPAYQNYMRQHFGFSDLASLFERQYLSCALGMRKPEVEIFKHIMYEGGLKPEETLFVDDSFQHVEGARRVGLQAVWIDLPRMDVLDLFSASFRLKELSGLLQATP